MFRSTYYHKMYLVSIIGLKGKQKYDIIGLKGKQKYDSFI